MPKKLQMRCPLCGSPDVFYSCEPKCCFNHVCAGCKGTFEPVTHATGSTRRIAEPEELPDASDPTVACAKCESTHVYADDDGAVVCLDCGAVLDIELTEICPP